MIGSVWKGYRVVGKIRDGNVGTVWKAEAPDGGAVAIQRISPGRARDARALAAFRREAAITRSFDHPGLLRVREFVDERPHPSLVLEYFEGDTLKVALRRRPEWVRGREFRILRQVADALGYVHARGVIHKDVKAENVLLSEGGDVRLVDFSLARTRWDRIFQIGPRVEGTPASMAPEQIRGERCDARTDVYAFGVLLYETLARQPPFTGPDLETVLGRHLRESPAPMSTLVPTVEPALDRFVLQLLAKRPERRLPDMGAVIRELSRWEKKATGVRMRQVRAAAGR